MTDITPAAESPRPNFYARRRLKCGGAIREPGATVTLDAGAPNTQHLLTQGAIEHIDLVATPADEPAQRGAAWSWAALPDAPSEKPADTDALHDAIRRAANGLTPDDPAHWTRDGKPDARALSERLGWAVSAAERDAAWVGDEGAE